MQYVDLAPAKHRCVLPLDRKILRHKAEAREIWKQPPTTPLYLPRPKDSLSGLSGGPSIASLPPLLGGGPRQKSMLMMRWKPLTGWDQSKGFSIAGKETGWLAGSHDAPFTMSQDRLGIGVMPSTSRIDWGDRREFMLGRAPHWDEQDEDELDGEGEELY